MKGYNPVNAIRKTLVHTSHFTCWQHFYVLKKHLRLPMGCMFHIVSANVIFPILVFFVFSMFYTIKLTFLANCSYYCVRRCPNCLFYYYFLQIPHVCESSGLPWMSWDRVTSVSFGQRYIVMSYFSIVVFRCFI